MSKFLETLEEQVKTFGKKICEQNYLTDITTIYKIDDDTEAIIRKTYSGVLIDIKFY